MRGLRGTRGRTADNQCIVVAPVTDEQADEREVVPWSLLVKDMPKSKHHDHDFIVDQIDWDKNVAPDCWIVYVKADGEQLFTAKELTVEPGVKGRPQCATTASTASSACKAPA
jgi:hypothetical protein